MLYLHIFSILDKCTNSEAYLTSKGKDLRSAINALTFDGMVFEKPRDSSELEYGLLTAAFDNDTEALWHRGAGPYTIGFLVTPNQDELPAHGI